MSDAVTIAAIGIVPSIVGTVSLILLAKINRKAEDAAKRVAEVAIKQDKAAAKVEEVRTALEGSAEVTSKKMADLKEVGDKTHTLVNSAMSVQLLLVKTVTRRLARMTKAKADITAADLAEKAYTEHQKQNSV